MLLSSYIHRSILQVFAALSLLFNSLLILLIFHRQSRSLGSYRFLLISFACCDIVISVFNALSIPASSTLYEIEFGLVTFTLAGIDNQFGFYLNAAFVILFYEPFVLLTFHFIFRYYHLKKPHLLRNHGLLIIVSGVVLNGIFNCSSYFACAIASGEDNQFFDEIMKSQFNINMTTNPRPNIVAVNYFHKSGEINVDCLISVAISISAVLTTVGSSVFFAVRIIQSLKSNLMSNRTRSLQVQLFNALVVQFAVPFLLCLLPLTFMTMLPLTGIRFGEFGNVMGIIIAIFPAADPIMLIAILARFRKIIVERLHYATRKIAVFMIPQSIIPRLPIVSPQ